MDNYLDRTMPILGEEGLHALSSPVIALAGLGGVGGSAFLNLVRGGVKRFRLAENGFFDPPDMNRQAGAFGSTLGKPKIDVYARQAYEINPAVELELYPEGITTDNMERFLGGSDVYLGAIDIEKGQEVKALIPDLLKRFDIPFFTGAVVGFGALLMAHHPRGMMPDELLERIRNQSTEASFYTSFIADRFDRVMVERLLTGFLSGKLATTSIGGALSGAFLASEVMLYLLRGTSLVNREIIFAPKFAVIDLMQPALQVVDAGVQ